MVLMSDYWSRAADGAVSGALAPSSMGGSAGKPRRATPASCQLSRVFAGKQREPHAQLCWEWQGCAAIRSGDWKAVWDKLVSRWELYDLAADHHEIVEELAAAYDQWAQRTGNRRVSISLR